MNLDGAQLRVPAVLATEQKVDLEDIPKKRNYSQVFDLIPFVATTLLPKKKAN